VVVLTETGFFAGYEVTGIGIDFGSAAQAAEL
jgi:hypothetical protein